MNVNINVAFVKVKNKKIFITAVMQRSANVTERLQRQQYANTSEAAAGLR
jgi:hypothetical protein